MKALASWLSRPLTYQNPKVGSAIAGLLIMLNGIDVLLRVPLDHIPRFFHAWSQTDRLALVHGFLNNRFNLFLPQSYSLNHHLLVPNTPKLTGITSVDIPIHEYLVSILMFVFKTESPAVFYLYVTGLSSVGLFFLYKATVTWSKSYVVGFLVLVITMASPMYGYYLPGFLPAIPAIATAFIGLFFLVKFNDTKKRSLLIWAVLFFSLSALVRFPFIILLIGLLCVHLVKTIRLSKMSYGYKWPFIGISIVLLYFLYNQYLAKTYGFIFIAKPIPTIELQAFLNKVSLTYERIFYVLNIWEFWWALLLGILGLVIVFSKKRKPIPALAWFGVSISFGGVLYLCLMSGQLPDHDYYLLDSLFVPITVITLICSKLITPTKRYQAILLIPFLYIGIAKGINQRDDTFKQRNQVQPWDRQVPYMKAFDNADLWLDSLNIARNVRVFVPDANSPNIPLVQMKRSGFNIMNQTFHSFEEAMTWPYDYIAVPTMAAGSRWLDCYPKATPHIKLKARKSGLLLYTYHPEEVNDTTVIGALFGDEVRHVKTTFDDSLTFEENAEFTEWYRDTSKTTASLEIICALPTEFCKNHPGWILSCSVNGKRKRPYHYFYDISRETDKVLRDTIHFGFTVHDYRPENVLTIYFYHPDRAEMAIIPAQMYILTDRK